MNFRPSGTLKLKKAEEEREGQNHLWENFH